MLRSGGSDYGYNLLKTGGLDMATAEPYRLIVGSFSKVLDQAEALILALVDQAHAGDAGFGFLKLGDVDFDDGEAAVAQRVGGARIAGGKDDPVAGADAIGGGRLVRATASGSTPANCAGSTGRGS